MNEYYTGQSCLFVNQEVFGAWVKTLQYHAARNNSDWCYFAKKVLENVAIAYIDKLSLSVSNSPQHYATYSRMPLDTHYVFYPSELKLTVSNMLVLGQLLRPYYKAEELPPEYLTSFNDVDKAPLLYLKPVEIKY